jgi:hypothetical protein
LDQSKKLEGHQAGKLSKRRSSIITNKNKNKIEITPKRKCSLNYREINNIEAHQADEISQKEEPITRSPKIEIRRGVESSSWWG